MRGITILPSNALIVYTESLTVDSSANAIAKTCMSLKVYNCRVSQTKSILKFLVHTMFLKQYIHKIKRYLTDERYEVQYYCPYDQILWTHGLTLQLRGSDSSDFYRPRSREIIELVAFVCLSLRLFVCLRSPAYQTQVFVGVSVIRGFVRIIAQMRSFGF